MLAVLLVLVAIFTCITVLRIPQVDISRAALGIFFILSTVLLSLRSFLFVLWLQQRGARSHLRQYILLCGMEQDRQSWKNRFIAQPGKNFEIRAEFDLGREGLKRFIDTLHDETIDIVVFSLHETILPQVREALLACEAEGVEAWISADFIQTLFTHVQFDQFAGQPLLIYRTTPNISYALVAKRVMDVSWRLRCASVRLGVHGHRRADHSRDVAGADHLFRRPAAGCTAGPSACTNSAAW